MDVSLQAVCRTADSDVGCAGLAAVGDGFVVLTEQGVDVGHLEVSLTSQVGAVCDSLLCVGHGARVLLALGEAVADVQADDATPCVTGSEFERLVVVLEHLGRLTILLSLLSQTDGAGVRGLQGVSGFCVLIVDVALVAVVLLHQD